MKILLINDYGTPTGGAEVLLIGLRGGLRARGHDARLFTSSARPYPVPSEADYECLGTTSPFRTFLQTCNPWAYRKLHHVISEFRPDIAHVGLFLTQLSPLVLLPLRHIPTLYFAMWYRTICPLGTKLLPDGTVCRKPAGAVCYQSGCLPLRDLGPHLLQRLLWHRWKGAFRSIVAHSSLLERRLHAEGVLANEVISGYVPSRSPRPPLESPPTVSFVGRLVPEKGVDTLIRALARVTDVIPDVRLQIIGHGPERPRLVELIDELGLGNAITLLGYLPRAAMEALLSKAWVQVLPSRWEEPLGLAALDAMMRGTAVIVSRSCGIAEALEQGHSGLLVSPDDPIELADALLQVLSHRDVAERLGAAAREIASTRLSESQFVDRFLALYARLQTRSAECYGQRSTGPIQTKTPAQSGANRH